MLKIISFMHVSLDGFVTGPNKELDWVKVDDELFNHVEKRIMKSVRALYGRATYELMESYWPTAADKPNASNHDKTHSKWYKSARKIVLSHTLTETGPGNTQIIGKDLAGEIQQIKQEPGEELLLFGSPSATHALMQLDLIDGYWLFLNPVVLGHGTPLFREGVLKTKLELRSTQRFSSGVVELNYLVDRS